LNSFNIIAEIQCTTTYSIEIILYLLLKLIKHPLFVQLLLISQLKHLQILKFQIQKHKHKVI